MTRNGDVKTVKLLLEYHVTTVFPPEHCFKPFCYTQRDVLDFLPDVVIRAVYNGHADILQVLICHGADVNMRSHMSGNTALHIAVRHGHMDIIKLLIEGGCNLSLRCNGKTALDFALNQRSSDIVQYLLDHGASFDQCLPQNFEGLEWAAGEPWYMKTWQYLVPIRGDSPNSPQDVEKIAAIIAHLLKRRLSSPLPHIIQAILDFAELWIVTSAK